MLYFICKGFCTFSESSEFGRVKIIKTINFYFIHGAKVTTGQHQLNFLYLCFSSMEDAIRSLDLSYNELDHVPFEALRPVRSLDWINLVGWVARACLFDSSFFFTLSARLKRTPQKMRQHSSGLIFNQPIVWKHESGSRRRSISAGQRRSSLLRKHKRTAACGGCAQDFSSLFLWHRSQ